MRNLLDNVWSGPESLPTSPADGGEDGSQGWHRTHAQRVSRHCSVKFGSESNSESAPPNRPKFLPPSRLDSRPAGRGPLGQTAPAHRSRPPVQDCSQNFLPRLNSIETDTGN